MAQDKKQDGCPDCGAGPDARTKTAFDPCPESQGDGIPCPSPVETCDTCGKGIPREEDD